MVKIFKPYFKTKITARNISQKLDYFQFDCIILLAMTKLEKIIISIVNNQSAVKESETVTCLYCCKTYLTSRVSKYKMLEIGEPSALCPKCKHPTLVPSSSATIGDKELQDLKIKLPFDIKNYAFFKVNLSSRCDKTLKKISNDIYPLNKGQRYIALSKEQAFKLVYALSMLDNARASYLVGNMLYSGYLGYIDYKLAFKFYEKASTEGYIKASINAGDILYEGLLGKPNYPKAYAHYTRASLLNKNTVPSGIAKLSLARFYFYGQFVKKDINATVAILFDLFLQERENYRNKNRSPVLALTSYYLAKVFLDNSYAQDPYIAYKFYMDFLYLLKNEPEYTFRYNKLFVDATAEIMKYKNEFPPLPFNINNFADFSKLQRFIHLLECDCTLTSVDYNKFSKTAYVTFVFDDAPVAVPECAFVGPIHSVIIGVNECSSIYIDEEVEKGDDIHIELSPRNEDGSETIALFVKDNTICTIELPQGYKGSFIAKMSIIDAKGNYEDKYHSNFDGFVTNPDDLA